MPEYETHPREPRLRITLTKNELAALIQRIVPEDTPMGIRVKRVTEQTFPGGIAEADEIVDDLAETLIRIHDRELRS
jgi:hypothetical protein